MDSSENCTSRLEKGDKFVDLFDDFFPSAGLAVGECLQHGILDSFRLP